MYGSDEDPRFNDPKTNQYYKCCCNNPDPHCWLCGEAEAKHAALIAEGKR